MAKEPDPSKLITGVELAVGVEPIDDGKAGNVGNIKGDDVSHY